MIRRAETGAFQTVCAQYMNLVPGMFLACIMRTLAGVKKTVLQKMEQILLICGQTLTGS